MLTKVIILICRQLSKSHVHLTIRAHKVMSKPLLLTYGVQAGMFACLASLFGKLALSDDDIMQICMKIGDRYDMDIVAPCARISPLIRAACFGMIFISNSFMWLFFTKTLNVSATTAEAVAVNSATNFSLSGLSGMVLFGEAISWKWAAGTLCIILGLFCINLSQPSKEAEAGVNPSKITKQKISWPTWRTISQLSIQKWLVFLLD